MKIINSFLVVFLVGGLAACSGVSVDSRRDVAFEVASKAGLQGISLDTGMFGLAGFHRLGNSQKPASVYIEGDGFAWIDRYTVSRNPTPRDPLALKLAALDRAERVLYLARPCQYVELSTERNCDQKYWTGHRFSQQVVASYNQALDRIKKEFKVSGFHLIGFSGGGAIVALLAAQRSDILSLRTIAGNLDHVALNKFRRVSPLTGSLDPIAIAPKLKNLPQIHYAGGQDSVVPSWVSQAFVRAVGASPCVSVKIVPDASHLEGWLRMWRSHSRDIPKC